MYIKTLAPTFQYMKLRYVPTSVEGWIATQKEDRDHVNCETCLKWV